MGGLVVGGLVDAIDPGERAAAIVAVGKDEVGDYVSY